MAVRVAWTAAALDDLDAIAEYISRDSPRYAATVVQKLRDTSRSLAAFPLRGRVVPELDDPELREMILGSYG